MAAFFRGRNRDKLFFAITFGPREVRRHPKSVVENVGTYEEILDRLNDPARGAIQAGEDVGQVSGIALHRHGAINQPGVELGADLGLGLGDRIDFVRRNINRYVQGARGDVIVLARLHRGRETAFPLLYGKVSGKS